MKYVMYGRFANAHTNITFSGTFFTKNKFFTKILKILL
ncbi:hypothetical protein HMPREF1320_1392 [Capnocytophaga sp. oral taxon 335 str. F0486]|nr:hypothetical protein HMPREF1320_1392 [Capnocytophaga sp. oral taxon 335 str. F0486]